MNNLRDGTTRTDIAGGAEFYALTSLLFAGNFRSWIIFVSIFISFQSSWLEFLFRFRFANNYRFLFVFVSSSGYNTGSSSNYLP